MNSPVETGSVESDNHPDDYPTNQVKFQILDCVLVATLVIVQDKTYHISASAGKKIKITFAAFSLEEKPSWTNSCAFDYLKVTGKVPLGQGYKVITSMKMFHSRSLTATV